MSIGKDCILSNKPGLCMLHTELRYPLYDFLPVTVAHGLSLKKIVRPQFHVAPKIGLEMPDEVCHIVDAPLDGRVAPEFIASTRRIRIALEESVESFPRYVEYMVNLELLVLLN